MRTLPLLLITALGIACSRSDGEAVGDSETGEREDGDDAGEPEHDLDEVTLLPIGLRGITIDEYDNILHDLVGDDTRPAGRFLPDDLVRPFDNDATQQVAPPALIDGAEALARDVAARLVSDATRRAEIVGCMPTGSSDTACMESFVRSFGRRALRRPLRDDEVSRFMELQAFAVESGDFWTGVETAVWGFLQHPELLYRVEIGEPVPGADGVHRLTNWELVGRLSFFLWGTTPNEWLLDTAADADARGARLSNEDLLEVAVVMLDDERARVQADRFHALWLRYASLPHESWLAEAMRRETSALIGRVLFDEQGPWHRLLLAGETFVTAELAEHYGLPEPAQPGGEWVAYGDSGRGGLLSHGSFLANGMKFDDTSPVQRGLVVRERLLCQEIPELPPDVAADELPESTSPCKWDRYATLLVPGCVECHGQINPAGWGLEQYDGLGRFRTHDDAGCDLKPHTVGEIDGVGSYQGPAELGALLADSETLHHCLGTQVFRFTMGRAPSVVEHGLVEDWLRERGTDTGYRDLLLGVVASPAFLYRVEVD